MSTDNNTLSLCANCGKGEESSDSLKKCGTCKMVTYCMLSVKKPTGHNMKKECRKHVAKLHNDALFTQPPPLDECPICFLRVPILNLGKRYQTCCGKVICSGCIHAGAWWVQINCVHFADLLQLLQTTR